MPASVGRGRTIETPPLLCDNGGMEWVRTFAVGDAGSVGDEGSIVLCRMQGGRSLCATNPGGISICSTSGEVSPTISEVRSSPGLGGSSCKYAVIQCIGLEEFAKVD